MNRIRKRDLLKVLIRSFYIQSAWNFERMLGLGLCFCLIPIARRLYTTDEEVKDFLKRHLEFFNAHPYMASFALGSISRLEEQSITQNWKDKKPISIFKHRMMGPLGALGDSLFWKSVKPLASASGLILTIYFGITGVIAFLIIYNFPHIYYRIMGIHLGYKKGFDIIRDLSIRGTQKYFKILNYIIAAATGILLIVLCDHSIHSEYGYKGLFLFLLVVAISIPLTFKRKITIELMIIITLILSITIGLII